MSKLEGILGYKPGKSQMTEFLRISREEKITIQEVASRYCMPKMYYDFDWSGYITTEEEGRISVEDYKKLHPWNKIIVIHGPKKE